MSAVNFNQVVDYNAQVRPDHKVVSLADQSWTYGELAEHCRRVAAQLHHAGIGKGDHVGILLPNQPMFLGALFGTTWLGAVAILINVFYGTQEIIGIIRHSRIKLLVVQPIVRGVHLLEAIEQARAAGQLPDLAAIWTAGDTSSSESYPSLGADQAAAELPAAPDRTAEIKGEDIALMIYTSGTTGGSKGVMLRYRGLLDNARVTAALMQYCERDVLLPALPLFSSAGVSLTLISILSGTHMALIERNNPELILEAIERSRVTILDMVPSGLKILMKYNRSARHDLSSLRLVVVGGDSSPPEVGRAVLKDLGCNFAVVYGLTETSPVVSITRLDDSQEDKVATVGPPIAGMQICIRDEAGHAVPVGEIGEVCCRGPYVMPGYYRDAAATKNCIDGAGWFATGDLGRLSTAGHLVIVGRKKDMVIIGGHNVFPAEVEAHLIQHPDIKETAVLGVEHGAAGVYLAAFVLAKSPRLTTADVLTYCSPLAHFKVPQRVFLVESFPYTGSGKVNKRELRRLYLETTP